MCVLVCGINRKINGMPCQTKRQAQKRKKGKKMKKITRTIEFTKANALFANVEERKMEEREITLPAVYESESVLLKDIPSVGYLVPLAVISTERFSKKYVISVDKFIENAEEIANESEEDK